MEHLRRVLLFFLLMAVSLGFSLRFHIRLSDDTEYEHSGNELSFHNANTGIFRDRVLVSLFSSITLRSAQLSRARDPHNDCSHTPRLNISALH